MQRRVGGQCASVALCLLATTKESGNGNGYSNWKTHTERGRVCVSVITINSTGKDHEEGYQHRPRVVNVTEEAWRVH